MTGPNRGAKPPRLVTWLVDHLAPASRREEIAGDLAELWQTRLAAGSRGRRRDYWRQAWSLLVWARRSRRDRAASVDEFHRASWLSHLAHDLRYAARLARRQSGFTLLAVATLALGIGAATAIFTICDRVLLQPLPYTDPDRIVVLDHVPFGFSARGMTVHRSITGLSEFSAVGLYAPGGLNLGDAAPPMRIRAAAVTSGFFKAMGATPIAGRAFEPQDDRSADRLAVLSFGAWRRFFREQHVIGRAIRLNGRPFTVVGVMPSGFTFPSDSDVWIPVGADHQITGAAFGPEVIARLAPGVSDMQAEDALARADARSRPPSADEQRPTITRLKEELVGGLRPSLMFLAALVGLLLAAASANVAGLLLSRLHARERELLLRTALGASGGRLIRQLASECVLLATAGAAAGLLLAVWVMRTFAAAVPTFAPHVDLTSVDTRVLLVGAGVTLMTVLMFGFAPAALARRKSPAAVLREAASPSRGARWFAQTLVVAEIATAIVLLAGTTAAIAVVVRLSRVDLGFTNARAVVFEVTLPFNQYPDRPSVTTLINELESRLKAIPGVRSVGITNYAPGTGQLGIGMSLAEVTEPAEAAGNRPSASLLMASPDFFRAMGIRLVAGRPFVRTDTADAPKVAILSETAARSVAPDPAGAVGKRVRMRIGQPVPGGIEVVGVVADARFRRRMTGAQSQMYTPVDQSFVSGSLGVVLDADGDVRHIMAAADRALRSLNGELPLYNVTRIGDVRGRFLATERLTLALAGAFAVAALVLAAIGLYGILAQLVVQRRREIGIRMALGADRGRLTRAILYTSLRYVALGSIAGVLLATGAARIVASLVPTLVAPPFEFLMLDVLVLLGVSVAAAWAPARRAARVDPLVALRGE